MLLRAGVSSVKVNLGSFRRFIGAADTGKMGISPCRAFLIETLGIARLANFKRGVDKNLNEFTLVK